MIRHRPFSFSFTWRMIERTNCLQLGEPIRYSPELKGNIRDLIHSVKAQGLEGLVAKRRDSRYEPGQRSGAWRKMHVNHGHEFVISVYTVGGSTSSSAATSTVVSRRSCTIIRPPTMT